MKPEQCPKEQTHRFMLILWFAMVTTVLLYYIVTSLNPPPQTAHPYSPQLFLVLGVLAVVNAMFFKRTFYARAVVQKSLAVLRSGFILTLVFSEATALMGMLAYYNSGWPQYWTLLLLSAGSLLVNFPRRQDLDRVLAS